MKREWHKQLADTLREAKAPSPESFEELLEHCANIRLSIIKTAPSSDPNPMLASSVVSLYKSAIELAPTAAMPLVPEGTALRTQSQMLNAVNELLAWCNAAGDPQSDTTTDDSTLDERAVAAKCAHPEWSDQQIADHIRCARGTLFKRNMVNYKAAKAAIQAGRDRYRRDV